MSSPFSTLLWTVYQGKLWTKVIVKHLMAAPMSPTDEVGILAELLKFMVMVLGPFHEGTKPCDFRSSVPRPEYSCMEAYWMKQCIHSVHVCARDIEILESFPHLGSEVQNSRAISITSPAD